MKHAFTSMKIIMYSIFLYLFFLPKPAFAYLDPGTGSYIFQLFIAGLLGSTFFLKTIVKRTKSIFGKDDKIKKEDEKKN